MQLKYTKSEIKRRYSSPDSFIKISFQLTLESLIPTWGVFYFSLFKWYIFLHCLEINFKQQFQGFEIFCAKFQNMKLNYENYMANFYICCPSAVGKRALRSIRIGSSVNKIDIFSFLSYDLTARLFFPCILTFFNSLKSFLNGKQAKLNEENKLRSRRNLLKGISYGTSFRSFVSFKHKPVQNQMGKVKPNISAI